MAETKYTEEHDWISVEGDVGTIGITQYAQEQLGDVVFVDVPAAGRKVAKGEAVAVVESVKAAADVHMPAAATVLEVNEALRADPSLANSDPEGAGWFYKVSLSNPTELENLMNAAAYQAFTG